MIIIAQSLECTSTSLLPLLFLEWKDELRWQITDLYAVLAFPWIIAQLQTKWATVWLRYWQSVTQRRLCPLNMSLWNWQTTFFRHRQRATIHCSSTSHLCASSCEICLLSTTTALSPHHKQSSATISCIIYNCFLFLFFPPVKPDTVQTTFRLTWKLQVSFTMWTNRKGKGGASPQVLSARGKECHEESQVCENMEYICRYD